MAGISICPSKEIAKRVNIVSHPTRRSRNNSSSNSGENRTSRSIIFPISSLTAQFLPFVGQYARGARLRVFRSRGVRRANRAGSKRGRRRVHRSRDRLPRADAGGAVQSFVAMGDRCGHDANLLQACGLGLLGSGVGLISKFSRSWRQRSSEIQ
jgi:hypothetical protein